MAGSPYNIGSGLSPYNIGSGLTGLMGIPAAFQAGQEHAQDRALAMSMRNLQLKEMERQQKEAEGLDVVGSAQIAPQMRDVPVTEEMPMAESAPGVAAPAYRQEAGGPYAPQELPSTFQAPTGKTEKKEYVYSTPHEKMAYELGQRADMLAKMGLGRSAYKLQQEAAQYGQLHQETLGQDAAKFISIGSQQAIPLLHKLGMTNIVEVGKDKDGTAWLKDDQGNYTPMDYGDLAAISSNGKNLSGVLAKMNTSDARLWGQQYTADKRLQAAREHYDSNERIAKMKASLPGGRFAPTADMKNAAALAQARNIPINEAWSIIRPDLQSRGAVTAKDEVKILDKEEARILTANGGMRPPKSDDPGSDYASLVNIKARKLELGIGGGSTAAPKAKAKQEILSAEEAAKRW